MTEKNHPSPALTPQSEAEAVVLDEGRELRCSSLPMLAQEEVNEVEKTTSWRQNRQCFRSFRTSLLYRMALYQFF